jgi:cyanophycin synthetase
MKVLQLKALHGPNVFHHLPVLVMQIDLGECADLCSSELPGFNERLLGALPGLREHHCSPGRPGGFVERLDRGTFGAHIIEHVALELSSLAGMGVNYGKSVYDGLPGHYKVAVRFRCEKAMSHILLAAVEIVEALFLGAPLEIESVVSAARALAAANELGPSTQAIVRAAERRNIPWARLNSENLIQFGYGVNRRLIQATTTSGTSDIAVDIAQNKDLTKELLERASIKVPRGEIVHSVEEAVTAFRALGVPVAVKPLDGNHGNGVSLGLMCEEAVKRAFEKARLHCRESPAVLVEELFVGSDFRVLVVGGKLAAAAQRTPAHVVGDGELSVAELVNKENGNPLRGLGHEKPMTRLRLDNETVECLQKQGFLPESVPAPGAHVFLAETANISQGGSAVDVTDLVHPENRATCERAARIVGLDICGIDLVLEDISRPMTDQRGGIIEVNAGPGIRMHHFPAAGQPRDVGELIVESLYPKGASARVPIVSITGTNGKTTVTRLTGHMLTEAGKAVGVTTSDGIFVGHQCVAKGDTTGPISARGILSDPGIEVAVLETARGGIVKRGLGYDWADVGVLTNIQADHFGQDGIETIEDVLHIKKLVAERVREGGALVLNADDPLLAELGQGPVADGRQLVYFSLDDQNPVLRRHMAKGGVGYFVRGGWIFEAAESREIAIVEAKEVPITMLGTAAFNVANCLAAVAAVRALKLSVMETERGLRSFLPGRDNSGRANVYRVGQGFVLVDYGHNPEAIRAVSRMTSLWRGRKITGVIAVPGDRSDEMLRMSARSAASGFQKVIVREDLDLRGRRPGETARILCDAIQAASPGFPCVAELDQRLAYHRAVEEMEEGEVVVFFYDDIDLAQELLAESGARPLESVRELELLPKVREAA